MRRLRLTADQRATFLQIRTVAFPFVTNLPEDILGGPIGIAAGLAVGIAVGGVIDWWMSSSFEAKMSAQLNEMIDELSSEVIAGDAEKPGLRDSLRESCDLMQRAYQESLRGRIVNGEST